MLAWDVTVPMRPVPQKRHRHCAGGTRTYDPSAAEKAAFLALVREQGPVPMFDGALRATMRFTYKRPKSHLRAGGLLRKGAPEAHVSRPDVDNLAKVVLDALQGVCYKDDSQIVHLEVTKAYGDEDSVYLTLECASPVLPSQ